MKAHVPHFVDNKVVKLCYRWSSNEYRIDFTENQHGHFFTGGTSGSVMLILL